MEKTPLEFTIRRSVAGDFMAMRAVNRAAWEHAYDHIYTAEQIRGLFEDGVDQQGTWVERRLERIATLVAEVDERIVGFCGLAVLKDGDGEIVTLYIHPDFQGRGIGTGLWTAGLDILRDAGCPRVWVWVLAQARAVQFYEQKGAALTEIGTYTVADHTETTNGYTITIETQ